MLTHLDTRAFSSLWYWVLLSVAWTWVGRGALGVPSELVAQVRRQAPADGAADAPSPESVLLLDWLSLAAPRWRIVPRDGMALLAVACFVLSGLAMLGFGYGVETAQALFLLAGPLAVLGVLRVRLAAQMRAILRQAEHGTLEIEEAAARAAQGMTRHHRQVMALSVVAVGVTAVWGTLWMAAHPNGL